MTNDLVRHTYASFKKFYQENGKLSLCRDVLYQCKSAILDALDIDGELHDTIGDIVFPLINNIEDATDKLRDVDTIEYRGLTSSKKVIKSSTFSLTEDVANKLASELKKNDIRIESIRSDYFEDIRCIHLSTENLNAFIVGNVFDPIITEFRNKYPEVAIEVEQGNEYFYGEDIYIMLADEYYID